MSDTHMNVDTNFEIDQVTEGTVPVLVVRGELDVSTAPELREKLLVVAESDHVVAVVDLASVSFVDSTALGVLVSAVKRFRNNGGDLRLVVTEPHITKVLEITGLADVFAIYASSKEAVRG
jgi:anti-sigma B factor antagonist